MNQVLNHGVLATGMRLPGLDGLRALAALAVFGVHYNQIIDVDLQAGPVDFYLLLANGEYGVALFFVLSGFLLSQPFWKSIIQGGAWPATGAYVIRRVARIMPAYYLALTVLIVLAGYWRYPQAWADILLHYSFLFNYAEFSIFSINPPFWTLAVEVQFYCLLPVLFLLLRNRSLRTGIVILVVLGLLFYGLNAWLVSSIDKIIPWPGSAMLTWVRPYGAVVTHSLLAHLPHFITGVICGGLWLQLNSAHSGETDKTWHYESLFWGSFTTVLLLLATELGEWIQIPYGRYGLPVVPVLLGIMIISTPQTRVARKLLDSTVMRALGALSYGVYIYHLPVLRMVDHAMAQSAMDAREHWIMLGVISLLLSLLAAATSYYLVERPVLRLAHRNT